eukprot:Em0001g428a
MNSLAIIRKWTPHLLELQFSSPCSFVRFRYRPSTTQQLKVALNNAEEVARGVEMTAGFGRHTPPHRRGLPLTPSLDVMWPAEKFRTSLTTVWPTRAYWAAMDHISNVTCIEFVPRTVETVLCEFYSGSSILQHPPAGRNPYLSFLPTYRVSPCS